jgi:hypothetical protein
LAGVHLHPQGYTCGIMDPSLDPLPGGDLVQAGLDDLARGLVDREELRLRFAEIEPQLYRYPAIDAAFFRGAVSRVTGAEIEARERRPRPETPS